MSLLTLRRCALAATTLAAVTLTAALLPAGPTGATATAASRHKALRSATPTPTPTGSTSPAPAGTASPTPSGAPASTVSPSAAPTSATASPSGSAAAGSTATASTSPVSPSPSPATGTATGTGDYLVIRRSTLLSLPTTGSAWTALKAWADGAPGSVALADQNNKNAGRLVAKALVYARTGATSYRDSVVAQLAQVPSSPLGNAEVLGVSRQLAGYVIAADLVGYRAPAFVSFASAIRTQAITGGNQRWTTIIGTSNDTGGNWGAWATASRVALDRYLGDSVDLAKAAKVMRGFLGDRSAHVFRTTADFDASYACGGTTAWTPINPAGCGPRDGAVVEDISRSAGGWPAVDDTGRTYSWETLGGLTLAARLLQHGGYPDVWSWSDKALLRAGQFLQRNAGYAPLYSVNQYIPWAINKAYAVTLGPVNAAGAGRQFGFTDWLD